MSPFRTDTLAAYRARREEGHNARQALLIARHDARYAAGPLARRKQRIMPGNRAGLWIETVTTELSGGYWYTVEIRHDDMRGPPDREYDGHGVTVEYRAVRDMDLDRDAREGCYWDLGDRGGDWRYDVRASLARALAEGWDAPPYRTGTKQEQAWRAIQADYEHLRGYYSEQWCYVGCIVTLYRGHPDDARELSRESCWGFESTDVAHVTEQARQWLASMLRTARADARADRAEARATVAACRAAVSRLAQQLRTVPDLPDEICRAVRDAIGGRRAEAHRALRVLRGGAV